MALKIVDEVESLKICVRRKIEMAVDQLQVLYYQSWFMLPQFILFFFNAILSQIQTCHDYALLRGNLLLKFDGWRHKNIL